MTDDGYRGYDINEEGDVLEYYDHRDEFKPTPGTGLQFSFIFSEFSKAIILNFNAKLRFAIQFSNAVRNYDR